MAACLIEVRQSLAARFVIGVKRKPVVIGFAVGQDAEPLGVGADAKRTTEPLSERSVPLLSLTNEDTRLKEWCHLLCRVGQVKPGRTSVCKLSLSVLRRQDVDTDRPIPTAGVDFN